MRNGEIRTGLGSAELIEINGESCVLSLVADITDLREAQAVMRESEGRFRLVANAAPVMIWMSGVDKRCTYVNEGWLQFTGRSLEEELGKEWASGIHPDDSEKSVKAYAEAFDRREAFRIEYRLQRHDGEYRWILDHGVPRFNSDGSFAGYIGSAIDVTERKQAEEALSTVSQKLIQAQEQERTSIARELHDDLNQRIALAAVSLDALEHDRAASADVLKKGLASVKKQLLELGLDVQALSHRLHSSKLERLGLKTAADSFCREFSKRHNIVIDFKSENVPGDLSEEISLSLFRILQEALQNAVKHSGSKHFEVLLKGSPYEIQLSVSDSGKGFDPLEASNSEGIGLASMRERLKLVDGELSIQTEPNRGTTISARVPLKSKMQFAAGRK
jgi:PAS domain S-box-containing protein